MTELNQTRVQQTCTEICRICGSKENLKHVFQEGTDELLDKIRICANIHIDALDSLPKFVCRDCEEGLEFSYRLRKRGEETEKMLRQELLDSVKIQPCSSDEENETDAAGDVLVEESREELYVKQEDIAPFDEDLIEHVEDEISPKKFCDETEPEQWITQPNETLSEIDEIMDNFGVGHIKEEPIMNEKGNCNLMIEELDQTDSQIEDPRPNKSIHRNKKITQFYCELCPKTFKTTSHFNVHKKSHSKEKTYSCDICGKSMRYKGNLRVHMRTIHKNFTSDDLEKFALKLDPSESSSIAVCLKSMSNECKAITTVFLHGKCKVFKCTVCDKISNFKATHIAHCRIHLNEKPFRCEFCEKSFRQLATLKEHELIHLGIRKFKCTKCSSSFIQRSALTKHEFCHTGKRPFECETCGSTFRSSSDLRIHVRIHAGGLPFSCDMCSETFREKRQVIRHKGKHHDHCRRSRIRQKYLKQNSTFRSKALLNSCYTSNSRDCGRGTSSKQAPIKYSMCQICGKLFVNSVALVKHRRIHLNLRPYKCANCQVKFRHRHSLDLHMRKHTLLRIEIVPVVEGNGIMHVEDETKFIEENAKEIASFCCSYCSEMFPNMVLLDNHLICYHDEI